MHPLPPSQIAFRVIDPSFPQARPRQAAYTAAFIGSMLPETITEPSRTKSPPGQVLITIHDPNNTGARSVPTQPCPGGTLKLPSGRPCPHPRMYVTLTHPDNERITSAMHHHPVARPQSCNLVLVLGCLLDRRRPGRPRNSIPR
jgi:hypothetical protein